MAAISEYAKAKQRRDNRDIYNWYKERNICPKCKKTWAAAGHVYCESCLKVKTAEWKKYSGEYNARKCKERREALKAKGLCVRCAKPAVPGRVLCAKCAKKNLDAQQVRAIKKRIAMENANGTGGD